MGRMTMQRQLLCVCSLSCIIVGQANSKHADHVSSTPLPKEQLPDKSEIRTGNKFDKTPKKGHGDHIPDKQKGSSTLPAKEQRLEEEETETKTKHYKTIDKGDGDDILHKQQGSSMHLAKDAKKKQNEQKDSKKQQVATEERETKLLPHFMMKIQKTTDKIDDGNIDVANKSIGKDLPRTSCPARQRQGMDKWVTKPAYLALSLSDKSVEYFNWVLWAGWEHIDWTLESISSTMRPYLHYAQAPIRWVFEDCSHPSIRKTDCVDLHHHQTHQGPRFVICKTGVAPAEAQGPHPSICETRVTLGQWLCAIAVVLACVWLNRYTNSSVGSLIMKVLIVLLFGPVVAFFILSFIVAFIAVAPAAIVIAVFAVATSAAVLISLVSATAVTAAILSPAALLFPVFERLEIGNVENCIMFCWQGIGFSWIMFPIYMGLAVNSFITSYRAVYMPAGQLDELYFAKPAKYGAFHMPFTRGSLMIASEMFNCTTLLGLIASGGGGFSVIEAGTVVIEGWHVMAYLLLMQLIEVIALGICRYQNKMRYAKMYFLFLQELPQALFSVHLLILSPRAPESDQYTYYSAVYAFGNFCAYGATMYRIPRSQGYQKIHPKAITGRELVCDP